MHIAQYENFIALRCCGGERSGRGPSKIEGKKELKWAYLLCYRPCYAEVGELLYSGVYIHCIAKSLQGRFL